MVVYDFFLYNRQGVCLYYRDWKCTRKRKNLEQKQRLMYGMIYQMKTFVKHLSPKGGTKTFNSFKTNTYKLHFFESASGFMLVLNTDHSVDTLTDDLRYIYSEIFVEHILKSPLYEPQQPIDSPLFIEALDDFVLGRNYA